MMKLGIPSTWRRHAHTAFNRAANCFDPPRVILTWHRVSADGRPDPARLGVDPLHFQQQITVLKQFLPVVPLADIISVPHAAAAITFDDGYADNLHHAAPALLALNLPATIFVTSGWIGHAAEGWWDTLSHLLLGNHALPAACPAAISGLATSLPTTAFSQRHAMYHQVSASWRTTHPEVIATRLKRLIAWSGLPAESGPRMFLNEDELRQLATMPGMTIGSHTCTHPSLAHLSAIDLTNELQRSRGDLETLCNRPITSLAYPYGTPDDVSPAVVAATREAGYDLGVTTNPGQVHRWSNRLRLKRHTMRNWDGREFARRLARLVVASDHGPEDTCVS